MLYSAVVYITSINQTYAAQPLPCAHFPVLRTHQHDPHGSRIGAKRHRPHDMSESSCISVRCRHRRCLCRCSCIAICASDMIAEDTRLLQSWSTTVSRILGSTARTVAQNRCSDTRCDWSTKLAAAPWMPSWMVDWSIACAICSLVRSSRCTASTSLAAAFGPAVITCTQGTCAGTGGASTGKGWGAK